MFKLTSTSVDQQSKFLQNMLKTQLSMTSEALTGVVTSTTAQGNLPQYRGSAAASLAPAMLNVLAYQRDVDYPTLKSETSTEGLAVLSPMVVSSTMAENRPLHGYSSSTGGFGAEDYMRHLTREQQHDS